MSLSTLHDWLDRQSLMLCNCLYIGNSIARDKAVDEDHYPPISASGSCMSSSDCVLCLSDEALSPTWLLPCLVPFEVFPKYVLVALNQCQDANVVAPSY